MLLKPLGLALRHFEPRFFPRIRDPWIVVVVPPQPSKKAGGGSNGDDCLFKCKCCLVIVVEAIYVYIQFIFLDLCLWKRYPSIDINEGFQRFGNTFQNKVIHSAISPPAMEGIWVFWSLRILEKSTCEVGDKLQICGLFVSVRIHLRVNINMARLTDFMLPTGYQKRYPLRYYSRHISKWQPFTKPLVKWKPGWLSQTSKCTIRSVSD